MSEVENKIRSFVQHSLFIENALRNLQTKLGLDIGHSNQDSTHSDITEHLKSLPEAIKIEAKDMAMYYVAFYCLENYIRQIIEEMLFDTYGADWWPDKIPEKLVESANRTRNREEENGVSLRSERRLDYLTFGELSEVIKDNWEGCFESVFSNVDAVNRIMRDLNGLRGPIAHCCKLPDDEVSRFDLRVRDLMRQL